MCQSIINLKYKQIGKDESLGQAIQSVQSNIDQVLLENDCYILSIDKTFLPTSLALKLLDNLEFLLISPGTQKEAELTVQLLCSLESKYKGYLFQFKKILIEMNF